MGYVRLTSDEFVQKITDASSWIVTRDVLTGELVLKIMDSEQHETGPFCGPDPLGDWTEYQTFMSKLRQLEENNGGHPPWPPAGGSA